MSNKTLWRPHLKLQCNNIFFGMITTWPVVFFSSWSLFSRCDMQAGGSAWSCAPRFAQVLSRSYFTKQISLRRRVGAVRSEKRSIKPASLPQLLLPPYFIFWAAVFFFFFFSLTSFVIHMAWRLFEEVMLFFLMIVFSSEGNFLFSLTDVLLGFEPVD